MVDERVAGPIEAGRQVGLGHRETDPVGEALTERAGGRPRPRRSGGSRGGRASGCPTGGSCEDRRAEVVAGQVEQRVEQHRSVARGEDEAVAIEPAGVGGL